jgi:hypothetical protein
MKKTLIVLGWLSTSMITLMVSITTIHFLRQTQTVDAVALTHPDNQTVITAPQRIPEIKGMSVELKADDARPHIVAQFLERYNSPLTPYDYWGEYLTKVADKYDLDFRLLPAIAMQESNLCKKIPQDSFNCLGLGVHSRGTWAFESFEANFDKAAEILRKNYINKGLITPDEIQDKYTPGSNGSWEFSVNQFMDKLEKAEW